MGPNENLWLYFSTETKLVWIVVQMLKQITLANNIYSPTFMFSKKCKTSLIIVVVVFNQNWRHRCFGYHVHAKRNARKRVYVAILRHPNITARHQIWMYKFIFEWWFFVCNWLSTTSCSNIVMPKFIYPQMRISQYLVEIVNLSTLAY